LPRRLWHLCLECRQAEEYAQLDYLARFAAKSPTCFFDRFDEPWTPGQDIIDRGGIATCATHMRARALSAQHAGARRRQLFDVDGNWDPVVTQAPGTALPSFKTPDVAADFRTAMESAGLTVGRPSRV
jgi:hypothetical protein